MFGRRHRRRQRVAIQPFPDAWTAILARNAPFYRHLSDEDQRELQRHVQVLRAEMFFEAPERLARERPGLYAELKLFFRQDPALWSQ